MDEVELVAQQTRDMVEETRRERAGLVELIRTSEETIEQSKVLIKRLLGEGRLSFGMQKGL